MSYSSRMLVVPLLILFPYFAWADSIAAPYSYVAVAKHGHYYFKMTPDQDDRKGGSGTCYKVTSKDSDEVLWRSHGWYAYSVYLSNHGEYLIRMGDSAKGHKLSDKDLAVAFYKEGKLLKRYSTKDLVKKAYAIKKTFSHYVWKADYPIFNAYQQQFQLTTIDKIEYIFNITNGEIVSQKKVK